MQTRPRPTNPSKSLKGSKAKWAPRTSVEGSRRLRNHAPRHLSGTLAPGELAKSCGNLRLRTLLYATAHHTAPIVYASSICYSTPAYAILRHSTIEISVTQFCDVAQLVSIFSQFWRYSKKTKILTTL